MGLLKDKTTTEVITNGRISGYVFADETRDGVQRLEWVMFDNFQMMPKAAMTLRPVTDEAWQHDTLAGFAAQAAAGIGWRYCHAQATVRAYERPVEMVLDPAKLPEDFQIEAGSPIQLICGPSGSMIGISYARKHPERDGVIVEYWKLATATLEVGDAVVETLAEPRQMTFTISVEVENVYDDSPPTP